MLLKWRAVLDNAVLPAEILDLPRALVRARARELLAAVGLAGFEADLCAVGNGVAAGRTDSLVSA